MALPEGLGSKVLTFGRYSNALGVNKGGTVKIGFDKAMLHVPTGQVIIASFETAPIDVSTGVGQVIVPVTVTPDLVTDWYTSNPYTNQRLKIAVSVGGYPDSTVYLDIHPDDPAVMDYDTLVPYPTPGGLPVSRAAVTSVAGLAGDITSGQLRNALTVPVATAGRPAANASGLGTMIYDTTLNIPLWSDGTNWRDATGTVR